MKKKLSNPTVGSKREREAIDPPRKPHTGSDLSTTFKVSLSLEQCVLIAEAVNE